MTPPRSTVPALAAALLAFAFALATGLAPSAQAASPTQFRVEDPLGDAAAANLANLEVEWDGATLRLELAYSPVPPTTAFTLRLSPRGEDELRTDDRSCAPDEDALEIRSDGGPAQLTHDALTAPVVAAPQADGAVVTYRFTAPALTSLLASAQRDPFACAAGAAGGDQFYGFHPNRWADLTPSAARDGLLGALEIRYATDFPTASRKRVACPSSGILQPQTEPEPVPAQILCTYSFDTGGRYRSGLALMELRSGFPVIGRTWSRVYPSSRKDCGRAALTTGRLRWKTTVPGTKRAWIHAWGRNVSCGAARAVAKLVWRNGRSYYRCSFSKDTKTLLAGRCTRGNRTVWVEMGPDAF